MVGRLSIGTVAAVAACAQVAESHDRQGCRCITGNAMSQLSWKRAQKKFFYIVTEYLK